MYLGFAIRPILSEDQFLTFQRVVLLVVLQCM